MAYVGSPLADLMKEDGATLEGSGAERMRLCFAHKEKKPSMAVNVTKGVFYCHTCHYSGNIITYLKDVRGLTGREAFNLLKDRFGWDMERYRVGYAQSAQHETAAPADDLKEPKWVPEIYPAIGSQTLMRIHEFTDAAGNVRHVVARWNKPTEPLPEGRKEIKTLPFVPAPSKGGGYWNIGPKSLRIPPPDRPYRDDEPMPIYGLRVLLEKQNYPQVWVVEGEKCADYVNEIPNAKTPPAVSLRHGLKTSDKDDPFPQLDLEPLRGRNVLVFADPDASGHKQAKITARALMRNLDCKVRIVLPPVPSKGEPKADDIADVAENGVAAGRGLDAVKEWVQSIGIKDYVPPPSDMPAPVLEPMQDTDHFRVLGMVGPDTVAILRKSDLSFLMRFRKSTVTQESTLLQLAPLGWWNEQCGNGPLTSLFRQSFGDAILRAAERKGMIELADTTAGRGAHEHQGVVRYNLGDRLLEPGADGLLTRSVPFDEVDFLYQPGAPLRLSDDGRAQEWGRELYDAIGRYRWLNPDVHKAFCGWVVASIVGGVLRFRPHLWLLAPAGSGKTFAIESILGRIFGPMAIHLVDATEASLAARARDDSLPVIIDEFEALTGRDGKAKHDRMMALLRAATSGSGGRSRGNPNAPDAVTLTHPRFSAFASSINRPALSDADDSRFLTLRLSPIPVKNWPSVRDAILEATTEERMTALRTLIIRNTAVIRAKALKIEDRLLDEGVGVKTRTAQMHAALTAGAWFLSGDDTPIAFELKDDDDTYSPLLSMMGVLLKRPGQSDITVSECLQRAYFSTEDGSFKDPDPNDADPAADTGAAGYKQLALRHGFKFTNAHGPLSLLVAPKLESFQGLMRLSPHAGLDWTEYLTHTAGGTRPKTEGGRIVRERFGGVRQNVVALGPKTLSSIGFLR